MSRLVSKVRALGQAVSELPSVAAAALNTEGLEDGIAALVCCRDEEFTVPLCLRSLAHFVDQIVCVDNGSTDGTMQRMQDAAASMPDSIDITVLDGAGLDLPDARNLGLEHIRRKWLLKSDGDFVFHTSGAHDARQLFGRLMQRRWPTAYRLGMINLYGDLEHTTRLYETYSLGEIYFMRYIPSLRFAEGGRFDYLALPRFYRRETIDLPVFFHLNSLKSDDRLIRRNSFFDWREARSRGDTTPFDEFHDRWVANRFGTAERTSARYRYQRQMAVAHYSRYDPAEYCPYPQVLEDAIASGTPRFEVLYRDGRPYGRIDHDDAEMRTFVPTEEDLAWNPDEFLRSLLPPHDLARIGIPARGQ